MQIFTITAYNADYIFGSKRRKLSKTIDILNENGYKIIWRKYKIICN